MSNQDKEKIDNAIRIFAERSPPLIFKTIENLIDDKEWLRSIPVEIYFDFLKSIPRAYLKHGHLKRYLEQILVHKREMSSRKSRLRKNKPFKHFHFFVAYKQYFLEKSILTRRRDNYVNALQQLLKTKNPFEVVGVLWYDASRGRSSIIFHCPDGAYRVMTRGSVANMENQFEPGTKPELIQKQIKRLKALNLTPMFTGLKKISVRELNEHYEDYMKARASNTKREEAISEVASRLERNMEFII